MEHRELSPDELEQGAGESSMDLYRKMASLIDKIKWASKNHGYRVACCRNAAAS